MSWKLSIMVQRAEFVRLASVEGQEFSEACSRFGISRKTGYKWIARFNSVDAHMFHHNTAEAASA